MEARGTINHTITLRLTMSSYEAGILRDSLANPALTEGNGFDPELRKILKTIVGVIPDFSKGGKDEKDDIIDNDRYVREFLATPVINVEPMVGEPMVDRQQSDSAGRESNANPQPGGPARRTVVNDDPFDPD